MAGERVVTVALPSLPPAQVLLRRITGSDEADLAPERPGEPTRLLAALARSPNGRPLDLAALPVSLHDRLLAEVYQAEVGSQAACRAPCAHCGQTFEFALDLADLLAAQDAEAARCGRPEADGRWPVAGTRVRPPALADAAADPAALPQALCEPPATDAATLAAVTAFLEQAVPLLSLALDTRCPHCDAAQQLGFDLPRFLVRAIGNERPFLIRETHLLAARYGWGHAEIMALPRDDRRAFAALIESERSAALRVRGAA